MHSWQIVIRFQLDLVRILSKFSCIYLEIYLRISIRFSRENLNEIIPRFSGEYFNEIIQRIRDFNKLNWTYLDLGLVQIIRLMRTIRTIRIIRTFRSILIFSLCSQGVIKFFFYGTYADKIEFW